MGVDCPDIHVVFHYGPPGLIEEYIQETGRVGRDGKPSQAIILHGKPGKFVHESVRNYGDNTASFCRHIIFKIFML